MLEGIQLVKGIKERGQVIMNKHIHFSAYQTYLRLFLQSHFDTLGMEVVVYDETEYFREWDDDLFKYPFSNRKKKISEFEVNINQNNDKYVY